MDEEPERAPKTNASPAEVSPWALAGLGMQFFVAIIVFVYVGNWLDARLHTAPVCLLLGLLLGGGGTFVLSIRRLSTSSTVAPKSKPTDASRKR